MPSLSQYYTWGDQGSEWSGNFPSVLRFGLRLVLPPGLGYLWWTWDFCFWGQRFRKAGAKVRSQRPESCYLGQSYRPGCGICDLPGLSRGCLLGAPLGWPFEVVHSLCGWVQATWLWWGVPGDSGFQKQARHFTPRNLCFLSGKIATGTSSSSPCGLTVRIKSNETHHTCTLRGETQCCAVTSWKSALSGPRDACWG